MSYLCVIIWKFFDYPILMDQYEYEICRALVMSYYTANISLLSPCVSLGMFCARVVRYP
jgi:hypothetical protein